MLTWFVVATYDDDHHNDIHTCDDDDCDDGDVDDDVDDVDDGDDGVTPSYIYLNYRPTPILPWVKYWTPHSKVIDL